MQIPSDHHLFNTKVFFFLTKFALHFFRQNLTIKAVF